MPSCVDRVWKLISLFTLTSHVTVFSLNLPINNWLTVTKSLLSNILPHFFLIHELNKQVNDSKHIFFNSAYNFYTEEY